MAEVHFPLRTDGNMVYLPPILATDTNNEDKISEAAIEKKAIIQNNGEASTLPVWTWFVFIGIAFAVSGGIAVFVIKRKK